MIDSIMMGVCYFSLILIGVAIGLIIAGITHNDDI